MRVAIGALLALTLASAALAQGSEAEQRQACMGDALRFCAAYVPDRQKVGACLTANRNQISPACRQVVDGPRDAKPQRR